MCYKPAFCLAALLCLAVTATHAQSVDTLGGKAANFSSRVFSKIQSQSAGINQQLSAQTQKYLARMARREQRMQQKMSAVDSAGAQRLFAGSQQQYAAMATRIRTDTGSSKATFSGQYQPYADTMRGAMSFLQQHPQLLPAVSPAVLTKLQGATSQLQALQAKLQDADQVKAYVQQRQQQIGQYIAEHSSLQGLLGKDYAGMNQSVYYYSQQVRQYKEMLNNPDQLAQKALAVLSKLPAFQNFMKSNSQLGSLFSLPGNYASTQAVNGLQTKDQVAKLVQGQVSAGGAAGASALQSNLQSAQSQLDGYKAKLPSLGTGNGDAQMPDFKPNDQKTKTFLGRIQYGFNFQTTHNSYYYPTVIDLGVSLGYKLGNSNVVGVGVSYKLGAGNGINDIAFTSQGVGLRSFLTIKVKGSFSVTGGFEYNYTTPFTSYQQLRQIQDWTKSGLIGVTKTVSMKSKVLKQTTLSLLWDFLSYSNVPPTQPVIFRVGYNF
jgi:Skp family chaperone for outer membrane proteins